MAVKAKAEITISWIIDIDSVTRYYLLQSSTASAPAKPTTNPPGGKWVTTEPSYTSGATNTLYFVDLTVMTDSSFSYSVVSKSSAYEAAKEAWNKANSKPDMDDIGDYVASRGENLVTNGTCLLGNNRNFSQFTFDGSDTYYAGGSFKNNGVNNTRFCDEFIPVDTANKYIFSYYIKTDNANAYYYDILAMYDIDKKNIQAYNVMFIAGSTTKLAKELKNGDTVVYLEDVSGFNADTVNSYQRGLTFWNYTNSKGYTYGTETYSRNTWGSLWVNASAINKTNNTITLKNAWANGTFKAGTSVSQRSDGGNYTYLNGNYKLTANTWTQKKGSVSGVGRNNAGGKFREGTAFVKIGWLMNRNVTTCTSWLSTISLTQNTSIKDIETQLEVTSNNILTKVKGSYATQEGLKEIKTEADQTANKFNWLVQSGDSATNFQLTDRVASLVADNINLKGLVTVLGAVTAGSFNLGSGKFKVSESGILEATDAKIAGEITANKGNIAGWEITSSNLHKSGDMEYTDADGATQTVFTQSYMDPRTLRFMQKIDTNKFASVEISPGDIYMYNDDTEAEFDLSAIDETMLLYGFKVCLDSTGLFLWNPNTWPEPDSAINVLNISKSKNLVIGYGKYDKAEGSTNIYGGTGIQFAIKSPNVTWRPYYAKNESVTISWHGAGYITSNKMSIHFSVPLAKPVVGASKVNISNNDGLTIRQNGKYLYGSSADSASTSLTYTANLDAGGNSVHIIASLNDVEAVNNSVCGIYASLILIFS